MLEGFWEMRVRIPPLERSLRTAVSPTLAAARLSNAGGCRAGLHPVTMALWAGLVLFLAAGAHFMLANAGGTTSVRPKGPRFDSAPEKSGCLATNSLPAPRNSRRMPAGLQDRASASPRKDGGSNPP